MPAEKRTVRDKIPHKFSLLDKDRIKKTSTKTQALHSLASHPSFFNIELKSKKQPKRRRGATSYAPMGTPQTHINW